ncbi:Uncharacterised protein r2_g3635 [Pycnogonum litorale]
MKVRLNGDLNAGRFGALLLQLGNGIIRPDGEGEITLPNGCGVLVQTVDDLMTKVYPNLQHHYKSMDWLCQRAILAPRNETVQTINWRLQQQIPKKPKTYFSIDTMVDQEQAVNYPTEFLNSLEPPGMPSHKLALKEDVLIKLLRNLDPPKLFNGTRLIVKKMMPHLLEAQIMTGPGKNETVFIPRIPLIPPDMPFEFKRLQFPVRVSFAMSINKAQGQSLKVTGLHLLQPCFSHGQLYVGCSRVGNGNDLFILTPNGKTKNVVYSAALQ